MSIEKIARSMLARLGGPIALVLCAGCNLIPSGDAQPRPQGPQGGGPVAVDVATAQLDRLETEREYTGTTRPVREVSLRSQAEGRLVDLTVNTGDSVTQGQVLARLDSRIASSAVAQAQAEVAARESEVAQAEAEVADAETSVERARLELEQARSDAARQNQLFRSGAVSAQQAQTSRTQLGTAEQAFRSAQRQVASRQQAVAAARKRIGAQQAVVDQEREREQYSILRSPVTGVVLSRVAETGNLAQAGNEILKLGDFSEVRIDISVSEKELSQIRVGQTAQVKLDALPNQTLTGRVTRFAPAADPRARLIPVEVVIPNPGGQIVSGLLARVRFQRSQAQQVVIPETALQAGQGRPGQSGGGSQQKEPPKSGRVFVVNQAGDRATVQERSVQLGDRVDGQVAVVSGLRAGESFVVKSGGALKANDSVRLSRLSQQ